MKSNRRSCCWREGRTGAGVSRDVVAVQCAGKQAGVVRLDRGAGGGDELLNVFCGDIEALVRQNESRVGAKQLLALAVGQRRRGDGSHSRERGLPSLSDCLADSEKILCATNRTSSAIQTNTQTPEPLLYRLLTRLRGSTAPLAAGRRPALISHRTPLQRACVFPSR